MFFKFKKLQNMISQLKNKTFLIIILSYSQNLNSKIYLKKKKKNPTTSIN